jgi:hypothetical protein
MMAGHSRPSVQGFRQDGECVLRVPQTSHHLFQMTALTDFSRRFHSLKAHINLSVNLRSGTGGCFVLYTRFIVMLK